MTRSTIIDKKGTIKTRYFLSNTKETKRTAEMNYTTCGGNQVAFPKGAIVRLGVRVILLCNGLLCHHSC